MIQLKIEHYAPYKIDTFELSSAATDVDDKYSLGVYVQYVKRLGQLNRPSKVQLVVDGLTVLESRNFIHGQYHEAPDRWRGTTVGGCEVYINGNLHSYFNDVDAAMVFYRNQVFDQTVWECEVRDKGFRIAYCVIENRR